MMESTLISLQPPFSRTLEACRNVFDNVNGPEGSFPALGGQSAKILDDPNDLMALRTLHEEDRLTRFLRHFLPEFFTVSSARIIPPC